MKRKQVQSFATEYLLPHLDGFQANGNLLYQVPVGNVLRGFLFDSSSFSAETFYPHFFVQPLYVPSDHLVMSLGKRFPGSWEFSRGQEQELSQKLLRQMFEIGLPFLRKRATPDGIVDEVRKNPALATNSRLQEVVVYLLLILDRNDEGLDELDKLLNMLEPISKTRQWERDLHTQLGFIRERLMRNPGELSKTLQGFTEQTKQKLHLPA